MKTIGIDMARQERGTAVCTIDWSDTPAVATFERGTDDKINACLHDAASPLAFDVPLGWPRAFVSAVVAHSLHERWPEPDANFEKDYKGIRLRSTDYHVQDLGLNPLSVSLDKLGAPAIRTAWLLAQSDREVDRSGQAGTVLEVYPVASMKQWGLTASRSYKGTDADSREELVRLRQTLSDRTEKWLTVADDLAVRDHEFDALICALTARAWKLGQVEAVPEKHHEAAKVEGWIRLPLEGSLDRLSGGS